MNRTILTIAAGLALTAATTIPAQARTIDNDNVGVIEGEYTVATADYTGYTATEWISQCHRVQRKADGVWRNNVTGAAPDSSAYHCGGIADWSIRDNTLARNTTAIRVVVVSGPNTGSLIVLCTSTADCQKM